MTGKPGGPVPGAGGPERGATAVEYALLAMLVAGAIITLVVLFGRDVQWLFASANW